MMLAVVAILAVVLAFVAYHWMSQHLRLRVLTGDYRHLDFSYEQTCKQLTKAREDLAVSREERTKEGQWHESIVWKKDQLNAALTAELDRARLALDAWHASDALHQTFKETADGLFINAAELREQNRGLLETVTNATAQLVEISREFAGLRRVGFHRATEVTQSAQDRDSKPAYPTSDEADEAAAKAGRHRMTVDAIDQ